MTDEVLLPTGRNVRMHRPIDEDTDKPVCHKIADSEFYRKPRDLVESHHEECRRCFGGAASTAPEYGYGDCPLCGESDVSSLAEHLPKCPADEGIGV